MDNAEMTALLQQVHKVAGGTIAINGKGTMSLSKEVAAEPEFNLNEISKKFEKILEIDVPEPKVKTAAKTIASPVKSVEVEPKQEVPQVEVIPTTDSDYKEEVIDTNQKEVLISVGDTVIDPESGKEYAVTFVVNDGTRLNLTDGDNILSFVNTSDFIKKE
jgi:hypothetical protein